MGTRCIRCYEKRLTMAGWNVTCEGWSYDAVCYCSHLWICVCTAVLYHNIFSGLHWLCPTSDNNFYVLPSHVSCYTSSFSVLEWVSFYSSDLPSIFVDNTYYLPKCRLFSPRERSMLDHTDKDTNNNRIMTCVQRSARTRELHGKYQEILRNQGLRAKRNSQNSRSFINLTISERSSFWTSCSRSP